jgi:TolB protein
VIACGVGTGGPVGVNTRVATVSVVDGSEAALGSHTWAAVGQVAWLGDNSGLLVCAWMDESPVFADQLWYLSYPEGGARIVTNDLNSYEGVSAASGADVVLTGRADRISRIWVAPEGDTNRARQVRTSIGDNYSEMFGLDWMTDGRIIYGSNGSSNADIWIMDGDGASQRQLSFDPRRETWPAVSSSGRHIAFVVQGSDGTHLWRMDSDGSNRKQLTQGKGENYPSWSPDERWIVFTSMDRGRPAAARIPADGGEPRVLTDQVSGRPVFSPDGGSIACIYRSQHAARATVAILPFEGGKPAMILDGMPPPDHYLVRWMPDGDSLAYIFTRDGVSNIWTQPVKGGPPRQLTHFKEDLIYRFAWSRDGKSLAIDRGETVNDVILIKDFR